MWNRMVIQCELLICRQNNVCAYGSRESVVVTWFLVSAFCSQRNTVRDIICYWRLWIFLEKYYYTGIQFCSSFPHILNKSWVQICVCFTVCQDTYCSWLLLLGCLDVDCYGYTLFTGRGRFLKDHIWDWSCTKQIKVMTDDQLPPAASTIFFTWKHLFSIVLRC